MPMHCTALPHICTARIGYPGLLHGHGTLQQMHPRSWGSVILGRPLPDARRQQAVGGGGGGSSGSAGGSKNTGGGPRL